MSELNWRKLEHEYQSSRSRFLLCKLTVINKESCIDVTVTDMLAVGSLLKLVCSLWSKSALQTFGPFCIYRHVVNVDWLSFLVFSLLFVFLFCAVDWSGYSPVYWTLCIYTFIVMSCCTFCRSSSYASVILAVVNCNSVCLSCVCFGWLKKQFFVIYKIQFQSNKVCYKVSLCENFQ